MDAARRFPAVVVKGGVVEGRALGAEETRSLATLDVRDVSMAKIAGLLLYALQTASVNLRNTQLEPRRKETVVIDPSAVSENSAATISSPNTSTSGRKTIGRV